jgi:hypothetical protein
MNIGVLSVDTNRTVRDIQLQNDFNCNRRVGYPVSMGSDMGVLGTANNRTVADMNLQSAFSCQGRVNQTQRQQARARNLSCTERYIDIPNPYIRNSNIKLKTFQ